MDDTIIKEIFYLGQYGLPNNLYNTVILKKPASYKCLIESLKMPKSLIGRLDDLERIIVYLADCNNTEKILVKNNDIWSKQPITQSLEKSLFTCDDNYIIYNSLGAPHQYLNLSAHQDLIRPTINISYQDTNKTIHSLKIAKDDEIMIKLCFIKKQM